MTPARSAPFHIRIAAAALGSLLGFLSAGLAATGETVPLSFEALSALVQEGNLQVRAADLQADAAERRTGSLSRSFAPSVVAEGGYESFETGPYDRRSQPYGSVEAAVNLYHGGRDTAEGSLREALAAVARSNAVKARTDELLHARKAYWDLVFNHEMASLLEKALARNQRNVAASRRRVERGLTTSTDLVEFELHGARLEEDLHSHEHEIVLIETALAPLLGHQVGTRYSVASSSALPVPPADHPTGASVDVAAASGQIDVSRAHARLASAWRPSLDIYGGHALYTLRERDYLDRSERDDTFGGARVSFPLFDGGQSSLLRAGHQRQAEAFDAQKRHAEQRTLAERVRRVEELKHELELIASSDRQVALGERYLRATLDEYGRGVKNAPDVVNALERVIRLQGERAARTRDAWQVRSELLRLDEQVSQARVASCESRAD